MNPFNVPSYVVPTIFNCLKRIILPHIEPNIKTRLIIFYLFIIQLMYPMCKNRILLFIIVSVHFLRRINLHSNRNRRYLYLHCDEYATKLRLFFFL